MSPRIHRRQVLRGAIASGAGLWLAGSRVKADAASPNDKLNLALIGLGGRGADNLNSLASENIVALCDVDDRRAGNAYERFPKAKKFYDYREMLDRMNSQIDAVAISTPDHAHFHPAMMALRMGKHLYCEKPMAHALGEVRAMTELAARNRLATQLGVQRHTLSNVHRVVELIQSGAIGQVGECHAWVGGDRGMPKLPTDFPPVPEHLKWDLWLGPAANRPYSPDYVPYNWRFWWDFGTGETGNWGCHILDVPFWALELRYPTKVSASGPAVDPQRTPTSMTIRFEFPAIANRPPVVLHWYHSKDGPDVLAENKLPHFDMGVLFVGTEGMLLCDFDKRRLYPEEKFADFHSPAETIPDSPGFHKEWIAACKGGPAATCNFDYSGPLTETGLLGNLAYRVGHEFGWDAARLASPNCPETEPHIHPTYRPGWTV
jgi:predicted dehydrogenase